jgi:flagellar assembly factor FliW
MAEKIIKTSQGEISVQEEDRLIFPEGIYAFEDLKNFYILKMDDDNVFQLLQSEEKSDIAFIIINPYLFKKNYVLNVREEDLKSIGIIEMDRAEEFLSVFAIVTITEDSMTANLLGPIIINNQDRKGKQALALNQDYSTKHDILEELNSNKTLREALGVSAG